MAARQVQHRRDGAQGVGEGHHRAPVEHSRRGTEPLVHLEARAHALFPRLEEADAEGAGEEVVNGFGEGRNVEHGASEGQGFTRG